jgi:hypothetical protein
VVLCSLVLPAVQASKRASIVSGARYVGCVGTMAARPSISDTSRIAELIDPYRRGARGSDCPTHLSLSRVRNAQCLMVSAVTRCPGRSARAALISVNRSGRR